MNTSPTHDVTDVADMRTRAAHAISAFSEEGDAAVRAAMDDAHGAIPSVLVLTSIALDHGCLAARDVPTDYTLA